MTGTPGPNNMMLTASGANFGYLRTLPHILGICCGLGLLIMAIAAGLGVIFQQFPLVQTALKWASSIYLLYLAWRIASAPPPTLQNREANRPMNWFEAAGFQFINPKAWVMSIAAVGTFSLSEDNYWLSAWSIALIFMFAAFPCISFWTGFGTLIGKVMKTSLQWRWFNIFMGVATASCLLFIWN
ncbi:LysE family translocator [Sansalvadorimonas verongulae]|uniref:LysE family translocator n=1 Tax=Sansalvadorimonas verongulae TaxID=2172824 RepID=UPI0012BB888A|nr:LysE family translocator [Sansalvadorimonas verongulae]MTI11621.1 LysE family translocator [Sansalvadorimonas verongulae]